eukprot:281836_1
MWKYIQLLSTMAICNVVLMLFNAAGNLGLSFSFVMVLLLSVTTICTYCLLRKTEALIQCCFKCLDCWIQCSDLCCQCCCCQCYSKWIKREVAFNEASHEYSNSLDKERPATHSNKSTKELPPNLLHHLSHTNSCYSTRSLFSHEQGNPSKSASIPTFTPKTTNSKSKSTPRHPMPKRSKTNTKAPLHPVQLDKQLSIRTMVQLRDAQETEFKDEFEGPALPDEDEVEGKEQKEEDEER